MQRMVFKKISKKLTSEINFAGNERDLRYGNTDEAEF